MPHSAALRGPELSWLCGGGAQRSGDIANRPDVTCGDHKYLEDWWVFSVAAQKDNALFSLCSLRMQSFDQNPSSKYSPAYILATLALLLSHALADVSAVAAFGYSRLGAFSAQAGCAQATLSCLKCNLGFCSVFPEKHRDK